ncbi:hypothetical protein DXG01_004776 [Tephrocybe rancida]|nr:hypothetical protein DXG01_004776 [Tephrocybe rancida]
MPSPPATPQPESTPVEITMFDAPTTRQHVVTVKPHVDVLSFLKRMDITPLHIYALFKTFIGVFTLEELEAMRSDPDVACVDEDAVGMVF